MPPQNKKHLTVSGIILASGFSRRMQQDKLLLPVNGVPLLERVIRAAVQSDLDEVLLVYRSGSVKDIAERCGLRTVLNQSAQEGQSAAVRIGIAAARQDAAGLLFMVGDQPFLSAAVIDLIISEFFRNPEKIVVPVYDGQRGSPVLFPSRCREQLLALRGDRGGRSIINRMPESVLTAAIQQSAPLVDIDTPEEYRRLHRDHRLDS
ncbi:molybdenum cofactor cytidylyltransferase [Thermodesulfobacteriota bacterium]